MTAAAAGRGRMMLWCGGHLLALAGRAPAGRLQQVVVGWPAASSGTAELSARAGSGATQRYATQRSPASAMRQGAVEIHSLNSLALTTALALAPAPAPAPAAHVLAKSLMSEVSSAHAQQATAAKAGLVRGGIAQIDVEKLERHISNEVETYSQGGYPRQSERYYRLMSVLHITRMLYHDGHCEPIHREFYRRLAQIHHQQQPQLQPQAPPAA
ncbi:hypothetical protein GGI07_004738 [Coemansia sp. Benny D115]|nr:hypothetical protein GGI07_004738 [Coemansia sp. Benny D115]